MHVETEHHAFFLKLFLGDQRQRSPATPFTRPTRSCEAARLAERRFTFTASSSARLVVPCRQSLDRFSLAPPTAVPFLVTPPPRTRHAITDRAALRKGDPITVSALRFSGGRRDDPEHDLFFPSGLPIRSRSAMMEWMAQDTLPCGNIKGKENG